MVCLCDEERHSIGAIEYVNWTQEHQEQIADFGIFAEPHYDHIVVGATGKALFRIEVIGSTCHGATPENGINAVSCMAKLFKLSMKDMGAYINRKGERRTAYYRLRVLGKVTVSACRIDAAVY